jgi:hypothetical protein
MLKFMFSKKTTKFDKSSLAIWRYVVSVKSMVKILSIFVAFLENMNFNKPFNSEFSVQYYRKNAP